jgi:hypothetical protein
MVRFRLSVVVAALALSLALATSASGFEGRIQAALARGGGRSADC